MYNKRLIGCLVGQVVRCRMCRTSIRTVLTLQVTLHCCHSMVLSSCSSAFFSVWSQCFICHPPRFLSSLSHRLPQVENTLTVSLLTHRTCSIQSQLTKYLTKNRFLALNPRDSESVLRIVVFNSLAESIMWVIAHQWINVVCTAAPITSPNLGRKAFGFSDTQCRGFLIATPTWWISYWWGISTWCTLCVASSGRCSRKYTLQSKPHACLFQGGPCCGP